jgi:hypothetical protein
MISLSANLVFFSCLDTRKETKENQAAKTKI